MRLKQKVKGSQSEKLAKRGIDATAVSQKVQHKYRDIACKAKFFPPCLKQADKISLATSHSVKFGQRLFTTHPHVSGYIFI